MPKVSKESASNVQEFGPVVDRREEMDGYTVEFVSFAADSDLDGPLQALPGGACQCPHWGYVIAVDAAGRVIKATVEIRGGAGWSWGLDQAILQGDAQGPAHRPAARADRDARGAGADAYVHGRLRRGRPTGRSRHPRARGHRCGL